MGDENKTPIASTLPKRDWKKLVEESAGLMKFVPPELLEAVKQWNANRVDFQKKVNEIAKLENSMSLEFTTMIYGLRKYFEDAGIDGVWTMDMGINTDALRDGEYIINLTPTQK